MKTTWSWWERHEIGVVLRTPRNCLRKCNHFRAVFATRVLRVYYVYGDVTTLGAWPSRPHRVLTAFQVRSPNLGFVLSMLKANPVTRRSLATMATTARYLAFLPRFYHVYATLMATLARSGPIFRRRRRAVRTPPRCDGGITSNDYNEIKFTIIFSLEWMAGSICA